MIIVRTPLRISLGGGGTDLPSYYTKFGGELTAISINKYIYICIHKHIKPYGIIKYSETEIVKYSKHIKHNIIRESLKKFDFDITNYEITSFADIPEGTGLGSSGAFTVGLIKAINHSKKSKQDKYQNAKDACEIEIDILKQPCGKQDQYIASFGGIRNFSFNRDGSVTNLKHKIKKDFIDYFLNKCLLVFTGFTRNSSKVLINQKKLSEEDNFKMLTTLHNTKQLGIEIKKSFEDENIKEITDIMNQHWKEKIKRSKIMSNNNINILFNEILKNGCMGGKLIGAGGGGFILAICSNKKKLEKYLKSKKIIFFDCEIDEHGAKKIIF